MNFFTKLLQRFRVFSKKTGKKAVYFYGMTLLVLPSAAFAFSSGFELDDILNGLIGILTSNIVRAILVLAIVGVGYSCVYLHKIPRDKAVTTVLGIGIILSASYIAQKLGVGS